MTPIPHQDRLTDRMGETPDSGIVIDNAQDGQVRSRRLFDAEKFTIDLEWSNLKGDIFASLINFWDANKDNTDLTVTVFDQEYIGELTNRPQRVFSSGIVIAIQAEFVGRLV